ncbi:MAG: methionine--tRNA ligase [bacterium]|nr:methionine--tRNA ligase [bacterium]
MQNKFYITTSIAYVNAPPHLGFALESVQADVLARWRRQKGDEVFFLTGTDEHGAKIARAAEATGKTPRQLVDENSEKFRELKKALNLSWDNFIRTSDEKTHWLVAQELWKRLEKSKDLYKKTYRGLYCVGHEAFVTDKDLIPADSQNHSERSVGVTLICRDHQKAPEIIEEENWFFKLSKYSKEIELRIKNNELRILPDGRKNEILSLLETGLEDISFSRPAKDLSWGVPVPGDETQTMYVWADALSNYISGYGGIKNWEKHPADIHLIGKDILRFHTAIWPAMLLSAKLELPKSVFVHGHILSDGQKMSKSLGNVVDPFELAKKYGADAVRYFILREIPSGEDGDFSLEKFEDRYNGDLANGIGNFAARVLTLASTEKELTGELEYEFTDQIEIAKTAVEHKLKEFRLNEALEAIWKLIQLGDQYVNEKKPWDKNLSYKEKEHILYNLVFVLDSVSELLAPFLPETAEKISSSLNKEDKKFKARKIENLFPRL